ncbi:MAG: DNA polymerase III subunit gamma/tau [Gammaproteobacteria bacterium]|nr:MAG: DNA polymerase III subunit gamma/tau [Gammaproteobacteria bacterium]
MSYQVLARKWRPRIFREMVGQEHVLQALINALDHNRLHHAYLFTGTRGVGKTTIARILAKCLNCETGVSSEPCGTCSACREIAEGRFVDLIEVDAASRTKVEDTRELLENVQYAPTRGRYKVYLIDEVHMLSNSSFNALLKTLEEPPPHVKFLLATTDPQKLPMTILSRCLQFNLKNMTPERIVNHLKFVLEQEVIPFEESALWLLGRAADGSMRDALSLTDQSISYGSGKITQAEVAAMLGTLDQASVHEILTALASLDGKAVLGAVQNMSEQAPDYTNALAEMLSMLHRIAIAQALPEAVDNSHGDKERIMQLAQQMPAEDVQLFYQTALLGRRDLPLAPDARAGFEMVLLRMLAFKPQGVMDVPTQALPNTKSVSSAAQQSSVQSRIAPAPQVASLESSKPVVVSAAHPAVKTSSNPVQSVVSPAVAQTPQVTPPFDGPFDNAQDMNGDEYDEYAAAPAYLEAGDYGSPQGEVPEPKKFETPEVRAALNKTSSEAEKPSTIETGGTQAQLIQQQPKVVEQTVAVEPIVHTAIRKVPYEHAQPQDWPDIYLGLGVTGILQSTIANCQLIARSGNEFQFIVDENNSTLYDPGHQQRLSDLLSNYFIERVHAKISVGKITSETPALLAKRHQQERYANAVEAIKTDPIVQQLIEHFGASLREDSIQAI